MEQSGLVTGYRTHTTVSLWDCWRRKDWTGEPLPVTLDAVVGTVGSGPPWLMIGAVGNTVVVVQGVMCIHSPWARAFGRRLGRFGDIAGEIKDEEPGEELWAFITFG